MQSPMMCLHVFSSLCIKSLRFGRKSLMHRQLSLQWDGWRVSGFHIIKQQQWPQ